MSVYMKCDVCGSIHGANNDLGSVTIFGPRSENAELEFDACKKCRPRVKELLREMLSPEAPQKK